MMFIVDRNGRENIWHLGEPVPQVEEVEEIQADCDELRYVKFILPKLADTDKRVVQWFKEEAQFLYTALNFFSQRS